MNPEDLRHLLSATPDEPPVPPDPAGLVHRRVQRTRIRRRSTAGALALALVAAGTGIVTSLPGSGHDGGPSQIRVATPTATTPTPTTTPTTAPATTPMVRRTIISPTATPVTDSSSAPASSTAAPTPLHFIPTATVSGRMVTLGGTWSGYGTTVSAATLAADPQSSGEVGSGVLGSAAEVLTATGGTVPTGTDVAQNDFAEGLFETNGDLSPCDGPAAEQTRHLIGTAVIFDLPGTYELEMTSHLCSGIETDTVRFTVPPSAFRTAQVTVGPTSVTGTPRAGLVIKNEGSGHCDPESDVVGAAYRCFSTQDGGPFDPCWRDTAVHSGLAVLCQTSPWSETAYEITISSGGLPAVTPRQVDPWAVVLADGNRCVALQGARPGLGKQTITYGCDSRTPNGADLVLVGSFDRSGADWTAQSATNARSTNTYQAAGRVQVVEALFGRPTA